MYNKRESAVSPVIAVVLILALVGVIVAMTSVAVLSNVDNILINDVKSVSVTVQISGDDVTVYPVSGKDLPLLEYYTVHFLGKNEPVVLNSNKIDNGCYNVVQLDGNQLNAVFKGVFDKGNTTYINIVGHFSDGTDAVIFTGKIEEGYVVATSKPEETKETYSITNNLNYASNSNTAVSIDEGNTYSGTITADTGYTITSITITVGGTNVTSTVLSENTISIPNVNGDIIITVNTNDDSEYYSVGSSTGNGYNTVQELSNSLNDWFRNSHYYNGHNLSSIPNEKDLRIDEEALNNLSNGIPIAKEPIIVNGNLKLLTINNEGNFNVKFSRAPGYYGALLQINSGASFKSSSSPIIFDGGSDKGYIAKAPLLIIHGTFDKNTESNFINNNNTGAAPNSDSEYPYAGKGGAIYNTGSNDFKKSTISENKAYYGGAIYTTITINSQGTINNNVALTKDNDIYLESQLS